MDRAVRGSCVPTAATMPDPAADRKKSQRRLSHELFVAKLIGLSPRERLAEGESDEAYAARLAQRRETRLAAIALREDELREAKAVVEPMASPQTIEAHRLRDIAARRREPSIENMNENEG